MNTLVGPVPVNISLTLGGSLELRLDVQRGTYYTVLNDSDTDEFKAVQDAVNNAKDGPSNGQSQADHEAASEAAFNQALNATSYLVQSDMDYLTSLRIFLSIRVFAGIGFDISILAC